MPYRLALVAALVMSGCTLTPPPPLEPGIEAESYLWVPNERFRWLTTPASHPGRPP